eukprot:643962-Amphidinium_carterae.2
MQSASTRNALTGKLCTCTRTAHLLRRLLSGALGRSTLGNGLKVPPTAALSAHSNPPICKACRNASIPNSPSA